MKDLMSMMRTPKYAAAIAAGITILAKWIDGRLSKKKSTLVEYLKAALYSAALVGAWVYMLKNPTEIRNVSREFMSSRTPAF